MIVISKRALGLLYWEKTLGSKCRSREASWEGIAAIQVKNNSVTNQRDGHGGGGSGGYSILKADLTEIPDGLYVDCEMTAI